MSDPTGGNDNAAACLLIDELRAKLDAMQSAFDAKLTEAYQSLNDAASELGCDAPPVSGRDEAIKKRGPKL